MDDMIPFLGILFVTALAVSVGLGFGLILAGWCIKRLFGDKQW